MRKRRLGLWSLAACITAGAFCSPVEYVDDDEIVYDRGYRHYTQANAAGVALDQSIALCWRAIADFNTVINEYPWSNRVDNAQYYLGRAYIDCAQAWEQKHAVSAGAGAIEIQQTVQSLYQTATIPLRAIDSRSNKYVDGQYYAAYAEWSAFEWGAPFTTAYLEALFREIINAFPEHRAANRARDRLADLTPVPGGVQ